MYQSIKVKVSIYQIKYSYLLIYKTLPPTSYCYYYSALLLPRLIIISPYYYPALLLPSIYYSLFFALRIGSKQVLNSLINSTVFFALPFSSTLQYTSRVLSINSFTVCRRFSVALLASVFSDISTSTNSRCSYISNPLSSNIC